MKVGDMVTFKHDQDAVGVITKVAPNIHKSVTYAVWVSWNFLNGQIVNFTDVMRDIEGHIKNNKEEIDALAA